MTDSRMRVINAYKAFFEYKNQSKYIFGYTNKELHGLEKSALKLASISEYKLALNIIENLMKIKPISKRYKSLFKSWNNLLNSSN